MSEEKSQRPLASKGFVSLVVTQFFGVINDNLLKQVLSFGLAAAGIWSGMLGEGGQSWVAMALVLPFLPSGNQSLPSVGGFVEAGWQRRATWSNKLGPR